MLQVPAERLALAGLNMIYGKIEYPLGGPKLANFVIDKNKDGSKMVELRLDKAFTYNKKETNGFYLCCSVPFPQCDNSDGLWKKVCPLICTLYGKQQMVTSK